jgi:hypothetical protein
MESLILPKLPGSSITAVWLICQIIFKKTGLTTTHYKNLKHKDRNALGNV